MSETTSFKRDILPFFTDRDIQAMSKALNLASYDDVKAHAAVIYDRIRGVGGVVMPPPPPKGEGPWAQERIELFTRWMAEGCQPMANVPFTPFSVENQLLPVYTGRAPLLARIDSPHRRAIDRPQFSPR